MIPRGMCRALCALALVLSAGCIPESPPAPPAPDSPSEGAPGAAAGPEQLLAEWEEYIKLADTSQFNTRGAVVAGELAKTGPEGIVPLIRTLERENVGPLAKIYVVESVTPHVNLAHSNLLVRLTDPQQNATTRACATALLGKISNDKVMEELRKLTADSEGRVSFAAYAGLAQHGDEAARAELVRRYHSAETTERERLQIAASLVESPNAGEREVLLDTFSKEETPPGLQANILNALAATGEKETVEALLAEKANLENDNLADMIDVCVNAINLRLDGGANGGANSGTIEDETEKSDAP